MPACTVRQLVHVSIQEVSHATEALQAVHRQQTLWLKVKAAMLAGHARHVRQELAQQTSAKAELELAAVKQQVAGLEELMQQQQDFAHTLDQVCQVGPLVTRTLLIGHHAGCWPCNAFAWLPCSSSSRTLHTSWTESARWCYLILVRLLVVCKRETHCLYGNKRFTYWQ